MKNGSRPKKLNFHIREFVFPEDYQAVIRLWQQAGPGVHVGRSDQPGEIAKKLQRDPDLFLIAETGGEIVGSVLGGFDGRRGLVYHLAVIPGQTRNGVGSALMEELDRRLKAKGCLKSYLLVTRDNAEAMQFYRARGWEPMDLLIYGKELG
jgi:ribosomal protein S18 acetylase RimI-like enzyme